MRHKNNGNGESNKMQNLFTRFLIAAIDNDKAKYLNKQNMVNHCEIPTELDDMDSFASSEQALPCLAALTQALNQISKKERFVLFARVLDRREFQDIANELGMNSKGASTIYYRTCQKLRDMLWR